VPSIHHVETGIVYRNPKPYLRSVQARHPSLVVFDDGEMLAAFDLGQADEAMDYRTYRARSNDGGHTWQLDGPLLATSPGPGTTHSVRISRVAAGVVAVGGLHHRLDPEEGLVNRQTLGFVPTDLILTRSCDRGQTWTAPETIRPPLASPAWETCHHVVALPDGRWLAPTATWRGWDGDNPAGDQTVALISDDEGRTWPRYGRSFDGRESGLLHWEVSVVPLRDGRLLALAWVHDPRTGRNEPTPYALSADRGESFGPPKLTGLRGQTCKGLQLGDGRILCVYRRDDRPGLWANLAALDGDEWRNLAEAPVWQGATSSANAPRNSADELAALRVGYPTPVQLADGDVFVVYWCVEDCLGVIRWSRLRVE
jgi:sialidase-1